MSSLVWRRTQHSFFEMVCRTSAQPSGQDLEAFSTTASEKSTVDSAGPDGIDDGDSGGIGPTSPLELKGLH